jgi:indolepyruvate ferredoxin oxidoreductase beta subunit
MEKQNKGVVIAGIGGQGVVLVSEIFTEGLMDLGYDVKKTEQHGLSQRGGSVNAQIKFGEKTYAPMVAESSADVVLAFEKVETLKWLKYLKPGGTLIVNDYEMLPITVKLGKEKYPENLNDTFKTTVKDTIMVNGAGIAEKLGTIRAQSMVFLGIMVKKLGLETYDWVGKIKSKVPPKYQQANVNAYIEGLKLV